MLPGVKVRVDPATMHLFNTMMFDFIIYPLSSNRRESACHGSHRCCECKVGLVTVHTCDKQALS